MTWWRDFFDAPYRSIWGHLRPAERTRAEVDALDALLGDARHVLDLCCGDARVALPLAHLGGRHLTGVDASRDMLRAAAERDSWPAPPDTLSLIQADARALPFRGGFDAVISIFSSIGFFDTDAEQQAMFDAAARCLRPGGRLILDTVHRDAAATRHGERVWFEPDPRRGPICYAFDFDPLRGRSRESVTWFEAGEPRRKDWSCRVFTLTELTRMLARAGLSLTTLAADFDADAPFTPHDERLLLIATRDDRGGDEDPPALCCPMSGQPLTPADDEALARLNQAIAADRLRDRRGRPILQALDAALLRDDHAFAYPIRDTLPCLLPEAALTFPSEVDDAIR